MIDRPHSGRPREAVLPALLMRHRTALFGYILSCVPQTADAEDILQEVSLTATQKFQQLRDEAGFLPWVIEIARRHILAHFRKQAKRVVLDPETVSAMADDALQTAPERSERAEALLACLQELPFKSAELMLARYDDAFTSIEQLAEQLGRTASATYALLKRTRMLLRDCVNRKMASEV